MQGATSVVEALDVPVRLAQRHPERFGVSFSRRCGIPGPTCPGRSCRPSGTKRAPSSRDCAGWRKQKTSLCPMGRARRRPSVAAVSMAGATIPELRASTTLRHRFRDFVYEMRVLPQPMARQTGLSLPRSTMGRTLRNSRTMTDRELSGLSSNLARTRWRNVICARPRPPYLSLKRASRAGWGWGGARDQYQAGLARRGVTGQAAEKVADFLGSRGWSAEAFGGAGAGTRAAARKPTQNSTRSWSPLATSYAPTFDPARSRTAGANAPVIVPRRRPAWSKATSLGPTITRFAVVIDPLARPAAPRSSSRGDSAGWREAPGVLGSRTGSGAPATAVLSTITGFSVRRHRSSVCEPSWPQLR